MALATDAKFRERIHFSYSPEASLEFLSSEDLGGEDEFHLVIPGEGEDLL